MITAALDAGLGRLRVGLSEATAYVLTELGWAKPKDIQACDLLRPGQSTWYGDVTVTPFAVSHSPGATGYVLTDGRPSVAFTADLSLRFAGRVP